jgi:hypothetical protein
MISHVQISRKKDKKLIRKFLFNFYLLDFLDHQHGNKEFFRKVLVVD